MYNWCSSGNASFIVILRCLELRKTHYKFLKDLIQFSLILRWSNSHLKYAWCWTHHVLALACQLTQLTWTTSKLLLDMNVSVSSSRVSQFPPPTLRSRQHSHRAAPAPDAFSGPAPRSLSPLARGGARRQRRPRLSREDGGSRERRAARLPVAMAAGDERARREPRAGTGRDWKRSRSTGGPSPPVLSPQEKPRPDPTVPWLLDRVAGASPVATPALCSGAAPACLGRAAAGSVRGSAVPEPRPDLRRDCEWRAPLLCSPAEEKRSSRYEEKRMLEAKKVFY